ncbi:hypothetical protein P9239_12085 [Caballeronia sp. LZ062]|uniref:hypothetical protein n=1 Tax=unclassified Caballeronia TaxID=2646786 RepID=UPI0028574837|nr:MULTISPECIES: hypothetical protein [unclassified Caballeronia]MDR5854387.1 hypothetical protein [Caballeronia sp. LZ050]MDR5871082.1 hypothetical protein [Caballeronia sp. LZ062]
MAESMLRGAIRTTIFLLVMWSAVNANACTISEDMEGSLPLNSVEIPNSARLRIADMVFAARQWPDVDIRGIVYAGGYVKERNPKALADQRASALESYLLQLGIKKGDIWLNKRIIRKRDAADDGSRTLYQIGVTLVPICHDGCDRLCDDPRVTPMSKAVK